ncbi:ribokinase [Shouchella clausii]|uniref:ribokinase n=1 Tax=Shouchella clausii TaxID=79880 RepID=UPI000BA59923|nr:ribokinase [Shouchella clausii]PAD42633.1 ribokinase [Bacillus sp. 7520-S]PAE97665.1 ribokinase [Shouchella clausii]PTL22632.1 ribokinase [Shouchella clausii]
MIAIVGSINIDLVVYTSNMPVPGETVLGDKFRTNPGGKGANQAVAAARLGAAVTMVGQVGNDPYGKLATENLRNEQVETGYIDVDNAAHTGVAMITVTNNDNSIVVAPGANFSWKREEAGLYRELLRQSKVLLLQLEVPLPFIEEIAKLGKEEQCTTILNPAPAQQLSPSMLDLVDFITPNETECQTIFKQPVEQAVRNYPNKLIVTEGKKGATYHDGNRLVRVNGFLAKAVDTTGAGDTFNGAFAAALASEHPLAEAVSFANAAASLSVEKAGAQSGMPTKKQVVHRLGT